MHSHNSSQKRKIHLTSKWKRNGNFYSTIQVNLLHFLLFWYETTNSMLIQLNLMTWFIDVLYACSFVFKHIFAGLPFALMASILWTRCYFYFILCTFFLSEWIFMHITANGCGMLFDVVCACMTGRVKKPALYGLLYSTLFQWMAFIWTIMRLNEMFSVKFTHSDLNRNMVFSATVYIL